MKVFISADIEGVNHIASWDETEAGHPRYLEFKKQMTDEVKAACIGAKNAGATEIYVKDAHDSALNLNFNDLPEYVTLHRGWEGTPVSMMAGLDKSFDAVMFIGYHSPSRSSGNSLSHTMNTQIVHVKINGVIASEFDINALYASSLGVPVAFLSGDQNLTELVKNTNSNIETVATKVGRFGAAISQHPAVTNKEIQSGVELALKKDLKDNIVAIPKQFEVEIQYKTPKQAIRNSFFPGVRLINDDTINFVTTDYEAFKAALHFIL